MSLPEEQRRTMQHVRDAVAVLVTDNGGHLYVGPAEPVTEHGPPVHAPYCLWQEANVPPDPVRLTLAEAAAHVPGELLELAAAASAVLSKTAAAINSPFLPQPDRAELFRLAEDFIDQRGALIEAMNAITLRDINRYTGIGIEG